MALIENLFGKIFELDVKPKKNKTGDLRIKQARAMAERIVRGAPEVVVKITGFGKNPKHVKAHLEYISRKAKLELENERGEILVGPDDVDTLFKDWEADFGDSKRYARQRDTLHVTLSMPAGTDPKAVRNATREFAKTTFGHNHEYVFVLHTDEPHPHCHVVVKSLGFNGKRLHVHKSEIQTWRETFAKSLRAQGVDAEATPRRIRGVTKKAKKSAIWRLENDPKNKRESKVQKDKVREAVEEIEREDKGIPLPARPWEEKIKARQTTIRRTWLEVAELLDRDPVPLTFNNKGQHNDRPNYQTLDARRVQSVRRAAALHQSSFGETGRDAPPRSVARVRNLSSLPVVHDQRRSEMFLQSHAHDRVGEGRTPDYDVRRARTGARNDPAAGAKRLSSEEQRREDKTLARSIRRFVEQMPSIDTERHEMKAAVRKQRITQQKKQQEKVLERGKEPPLEL